MIENDDKFTRIKWLFGKDGFEKLQSAKVLICGAGGVGGACAEVLARSGVGNLAIIDKDIFEITNQNRQIGSEFIGEKKVEVFAKKFSCVKPIFAKIDDDFLQNFDFSEFDFIVDAIDDIPAKVALANKVFSFNNANLISSMGGAKRINPALVELTSIWKTTNDALAKKFRYELRKSGFNGDFMVVYSKEEPVCENLGSFMGVTATFGNFLASYVVKKLLESDYKLSV